jgi:hypothetical protein
MSGVTVMIPVFFEPATLTDHDVVGIAAINGDRLLFGNCNDVVVIAPREIIIAHGTASRLAATDNPDLARNSATANQVGLARY